MLELMMSFCQTARSCKDPFVIAVLWRGDVHLRACNADGLKDASLYLIGPEDLSLVTIFLLAVQRVAVLPPGPTVFGLYLSDYTCLLDHHLVGPGVPIFAYLRRDTSWVIPWPSSFTVHSTYQVEQWLKQEGRPRARGRTPPGPEWATRTPKAYWIGAITGPWELATDLGLMAVPRLKLLRLAREHPGLLQAEWSSVARYGISWVRDENHVAGLRANGSRAIEDLTGVARSGFKTLREWANFKYYVNLDGVVMGGRLSKLLALGGVVLQQKAGYFEHVDALARPYEHYVPVEYDLSDLVAKVEWLRRHDREARRMARRARALALRRMRLEDHLCYAWRALEALAAKTASGKVDAKAVGKRLRDLNFQQVSMIDQDMRKTLESLWGVPLESARAGERVMSAGGIQLLQWTWDRFGAMWRRAHGDDADDGAAA